MKMLRAFGCCGPGDDEDEVSCYSNNNDVEDFCCVFTHVVA